MGVASMGATVYDLTGTWTSTNAPRLDSDGSTVNRVTESHNVTGTYDDSTGIYTVNNFYGVEGYNFNFMVVRGTHQLLMQHSTGPYQRGWWGGIKTGVTLYDSTSDIWSNDGYEATIDDPWKSSFTITGINNYGGDWTESFSWEITTPLTTVVFLDENGEQLSSNRYATVAKTFSSSDYATLQDLGDGATSITTEEGNSYTITYKLAAGQDVTFYYTRATNGYNNLFAAGGVLKIDNGIADTFRLFESGDGFYLADISAGVFVSALSGTSMNATDAIMLYSGSSDAYPFYRWIGTSTSTSTQDKWNDAGGTAANSRSTSTVAGWDYNDIGSQWIKVADKTAFSANYNSSYFSALKTSYESVKSLAADNPDKTTYSDAVAKVSTIDLGSTSHADVEAYKKELDTIILEAALASQTPVKIKYTRGYNGKVNVAADASGSLKITDGDADQFYLISEGSGYYFYDKTAGRYVTGLGSTSESADDAVVLYVGNSDAYPFYRWIGTSNSKSGNNYWNDYQGNAKNGSDGSVSGWTYNDPGSQWILVADDEAYAANVASDFYSALTTAYSNALAVSTLYPSQSADLNASVASVGNYDLGATSHSDVETYKTSLETQFHALHSFLVEQTSAALVTNEVPGYLDPNGDVETPIAELVTAGDSADDAAMVAALKAYVNATASSQTTIYTSGFYYIISDAANSDGNNNVATRGKIYNDATNGLYVEGKSGYVDTENDANNQWQFKEIDGQYYLYNVGAAKYAAPTSTGSTSSWDSTGNYKAWQLVDFESALPIRLSAATTGYPYVEIVAVTAAASEDETETLTHLCVSPGYNYPIMTYYDNANDAGLPLRFEYVTTSSESVSLSEVTADGAVATDAIYDLQGRRVSSMARPGIYIVNGRKVKK
jgi:hypothetical protein